MINLKKIFLITTMISLSFGLSGHYSATSLKKELVRIDNFTKELRTIDNEEAKKLVTYLEEVLKNEAGYYYASGSELRYISEDEVLAITRAIDTAELSFETKQAELTTIMIEEIEKEAKRKEKAYWDKIQQYAGIAAAYGFFFGGMYCATCLHTC